MTTKRRVLAVLCGVSSLFLASANSASAAVIYDALPRDFDGPNTTIPGYGYERYSIAEMGDRMSLAGTARQLESVTVGLDSRAKWFRYRDRSDWEPGGYPVRLPFEFVHPLTLSIFNPDTVSYSDGSIGDTVGDLLVSKTIETTIKFDPANPGSYYFNVDFDFLGSDIVLPDTVVTTLAFNTETSGYHPSGERGPYNDLYFAVSLEPAKIGSDRDVGDMYFSGNFASDGSFVDMASFGGYGITTPAIKISARDTPYTVPEPTGLVLLGLSGIGLLAWRRRQSDPIR